MMKRLYGAPLVLLGDVGAFWRMLEVAGAWWHMFLVTGGL